VELAPGEGRILEHGIEALRELGLEIEHFGGNTFLLQSVPAILLDARWEELIGDLVTMLDEEKDIGNEKALDRFLTISACHGAIRAGQRLSLSEMTLLIDQLEDTHLPTNCPHGRPVAKKISFYEIEKMFKRVV
jgi:DNA mismatch repair protein MutL